MLEFILSTGRRNKIRRVEHVMKSGRGKRERASGKTVGGRFGGKRVKSAENDPTAPSPHIFPILLHLSHRDFSNRAKRQKNAFTVKIVLLSLATPWPLPVELSAGCRDGSSSSSSRNAHRLISTCPSVCAAVCTIKVSSNRGPAESRDEREREEDLHSVETAFPLCVSRH